jgi:hypothetical protein
MPLPSILIVSGIGAWKGVDLGCYLTLRLLVGQKNALSIDNFLLEEHR